jgi:pimeloyl-ACP methyl ester carboxylesterase
MKAVSEQNFIYKENIITFHKYGEGSDFVLCFHGAMQTSSYFKTLQNSLSNYTIIALDLPYHGHTKWNENILTPKTIHELIISFYQFLGIKKAHIIAYSIGAKLAHAIIFQNPQLVRSIIYIAPDGLYENIWYKLATRTSIGNRIFKWYAKHSIKINLSLSQLHLLPKDAQLIIQAYNHEDFGNKLYNIWNGFKLLNFNIQTILDITHNNHIPISVILGKNDNIIKLKNVKTLIKRNNYVNWMILPIGHHFNIHKIAAHIKNHFSAL